jgi:predicted P-loop ATPase
MAEVARTLSEEVEQFKVAIGALDEDGFKKEVGRIAWQQPENLGLRDAIAEIAEAEFKGGGQAALKVWEEVQTASRKVDAHTHKKLVAQTRELGFSTSKSPTGIAQSLSNALIALKLLEVDCRYDLFHDRIIVKGYESGLTGDALENLDNVCLKIRQAALVKFSFDPGKQHTLDALTAWSFDHMFDPVRDYLDSVRWDGVPRLDRWVVRYLGAQDTALNRAIGRKMLIAAVRRVRKPGCKFDYITVFESPQGAGKSSALKILAGEENFSDAEIVGLDKREQQEAVQGVWIYEIGELEGLTRSEVSKVKLFASKTVDSARPAYGRSRVDRPRRCIFAATTNDDKYLRDTTGNRRFWPIKVAAKIDLTVIARDRDQLWAEAALAEATGEGLVIPEALWPEATARQLARMEVDPWQELLDGWLANMEAEGRNGVSGTFTRSTGERDTLEWRISTNFLLTTVLGVPQERQTNTHTKRLAGIMRGLGWTRSEETMRIGKLVCRGYVKAIGEPVTPQVAPHASVLAPKLAVLNGGREEKPQEKDVTGVTFRRRAL